MCMYICFNFPGDSDMQPELRTTGLERQGPELRAPYTTQGFWTIS